MKSKNLLFAALFTVSAKASFSQAGELDSSFNTDGIVVTDVSTGDDIAHGVAVQPDGKIVAVGFEGFTQYNSPDFAAVRYNVDGSPDSSFGTNGKVITPIGTGPDEANAVSIQQDGKIVAAGYTYSASYASDFVVIRYNADGSPDSSFGGDGKVITATVYNEVPNAMAIQQDGKIVTAGFVDDGIQRFKLIRYDSDGTPDSTFGINGIVTTAFGSYPNAGSVAIQADGKILAAGVANHAFALVRYTSAGVLDSTFGTYGKVNTSMGTGTSAINAIAIQPDGRIVAAGTDEEQFQNNIALARYKSDGSPDSTFGTDGIVITSISDNAASGNSMILQNDGKIIVAGTGGFQYNNNDFAVVRYNNNGSLDTAFGISGIAVTPIGPYHDVAYSVAEQPDTKIVAAGYSFVGPKKSFALTRYLSDDLALGAIDFSAPVTLLVYPNPVHQNEQLKYTLSDNEMLSLSLLDVNGKTVRSFFINEFREKGIHREQLNFVSLPAGSYFLTLSEGRKQVSVKIIVQ